MTSSVTSVVGTNCILAINERTGPIPKPEPTEKIEIKPPFRIDFPLDKIAWDLFKAGKIDEKGIVQNLTCLSGLNNHDLQLILNTTLHLKIKHADKTEDVEIPIREILNKIGNHNYIIGSYIFTLLGNKWAVKYLEQYISVDPKWIAHFGKKRTDIDFRAIIDVKEDCRLKAEEVVNIVADLSTSSLGKESIQDLVRMIGGTFSKFHSFNKIEKGEYREDSFQISHEENDFSVDINISRLPPKEVLSRQDFRVCIQPLLDGQQMVISPEGNGNTGEQAVVDTILLQYHFLRYTPQAWARSIVYNCESNRHVGTIPQVLLIEIKEFCLRYESIGKGLKVLFREYIKKHFKCNPNAIAALAFNTAIALQTKDFHPDDIKEFVIEIRKFLSSEVEMLLLYKNILDLATTERFEHLQTAIEINLLFELAAQPAKERNFNQDSNFIVTHNGTDWVTAKKSGFSLLVPVDPLRTLENLWTACQSDEMPIMTKILKAILKTNFQKVSKDNILLANFSPEDLKVDQIYNYAKKFLSCKNPDLKVLGYKLLMLCNSIKPTKDLAYELKGELTFIIPHIDRAELKNLFDYFKVFLVPIEIHERLDPIRLQLDPQESYVHFLTLHFPQICISVVYKHPALVKNFLKFIDETLNSALQLGLKLSKEDFDLIANIANYHIQKENNREVLQALYSLVEGSLKKGNSRTATLFLTSFTHHQVFCPITTTANLWFKVINVLHSSNPSEAQSLIILGHREEIWRIAPSDLQFPEWAPDIIEKLVSKNHYESTEAADEFLEFIRCNTKSEQSEKWVNLVKNKLKRDQSKNESRGSIENSLKVLRALNEDDESAINQTQVLMRKALKENVLLAKEILLDPFIRSFFSDHPNEYLEMILSSIDNLLKSKRVNTDILSYFLEAPLCFGFVSSKSDPSRVAEYLLRMTSYFTKEKTSSSPSLMFAIDQNFVLLMQMMKASKRFEIIYDFLKSYVIRKNELKITASFYFDCLFEVLHWSMDQSECQSEIVLKIMKFLDISVEEDQLDHYIQCQLGMINHSILRKLDDVAGFLINALIEQLKKFGKFNDHRWGNELLELSITLAKGKKYVLSARLLHTIEKNKNQNLIKLIENLPEVPEEVLKLCPAVFSKAISNANTDTLSSSHYIIKIQTIVQYNLSSSVNRETGEVALEIVDKYFTPTDPTTVLALEYIQSLNCKPLSERTLSIYSTKLSSMAFQTDWLEDPKGIVVRNWLKGWTCAMRVAQSLSPNVASTFIHAQLNDLINHKSLLSQTLNRFTEFQAKTLSTVIKSFFKTVSSGGTEDSLSKIENLISRLKEPSIDFKDIEEFEDELMLRFLVSNNLDRFIQGCNYIIQQSKLSHPSMSLSKLTESAISGFVRIKERVQIASVFREAMRLASGVIDENYHPKYASMLEKRNLEEVIFFTPIMIKETKTMYKERVPKILRGNETKDPSNFLCERSRYRRHPKNSSIVHPRDLTENDLKRQAIFNYISKMFQFVPNAAFSFERPVKIIYSELTHEYRCFVYFTILSMTTMLVRKTLLNRYVASRENNDSMPETFDKVLAHFYTFLFNTLVIFTVVIGIKHYRNYQNRRAD